MKSVFGYLVAPKILVVGLGESGLAMVRHALNHGAKVVVVDTRTEPPGLKQLDLLAIEFPNLEWHLGHLDREYLQGVDIVAMSPGLSPYQSDVLPLLSEARERHIEIWGELNFYARAMQYLQLSQQYRPFILAITGTNGKTTTTQLTAHLCDYCGMRAVVAGNISPSLLDRLAEQLAKPPNEWPEVWVLELSSFQLHYDAPLNPHAAAILNITQDHLDWHGDMKGYASDKGKILGENTCAIVNRTDPLVLEVTQSAQQRITFGVDIPKIAGDYGLIEDGILWIGQARVDEIDLDKRSRNNSTALPPVVKVVPLMPSDALKIRGLHNAMNAMAALALCRHIGLPLHRLLHGLREYVGEPHRVEWVAQIDGVDYIDDSKGTNVGATVAALNGLGSKDKKHIILIAGGDGKGQDFTDLAEPIAAFCRMVFLIGKDANRMASYLMPDQVQQMASLEEATQKAAQLAQQGDVVLLSPACASLDMFRDYRHRAEVFVNTVKSIGIEKGMVSIS